ncbi:sodium/proline symporter PutP [Chromatiaceae bacterium AAb-1]|nr:sodium/proline symporter PutP [Chromatiaceae bacterium AAb-1]
METGVIISLSVYFISMIAIGLYAYRVSTNDMSGYMLGGRQLGPTLTAMSAGASDMSSWILMGLPGALYLNGLSSAWIIVGLLIGAYANYLFVAPRLRVYTEIASDAITLPDYFENRFEDKSRTLRLISSLVIIVFFTLYTSSGLVGGGKLFESSFGLSYELGLYVTAGVVVIYTVFGGFLGVSMTDLAQGLVMLIALVLVPWVVFDNLGGVIEVTDTINQLDPQYLSWFGTTSAIAIISAIAWGLGYFGQPHIVVRFMAIRSVKDVKVARRIGMSWMFVTISGAAATGLVGIAYVAKTGMELADPETIFIVFSQILFNPLISGFLLAAILAAIMSTVSSQLLVTSSSLTEDLYKTFFRRSASQKELVLLGRLSVIIVSFVAIALAYDRDSSILDLVSNAWAGFGAAFGPLILFSLFWKRMTYAGALAGMLTGAITVLIWIYLPVVIDGEKTHLSSLIYEIVPGFIISTLSIIIVSLMTKAPSASMQLLFDQMLHHLKRETTR